MSNWNPIDSPVDYIVLAGKKSPGIATIFGADRPRKYDEQNGYGLSGATLRFTGLGLSHFKVELMLYTTEDWDAWNVWKSVLDKPPTGRVPQSLSIRHPLLDSVQISQVVVENDVAPEQVGDGVWKVEIKFSQFRKVRIALAKIEGTKDTPVDPADKAIAALTALEQRGARGGSVGLSDVGTALSPLFGPGQVESLSK